MRSKTHILLSVQCLMIIGFFIGGQFFAQEPSAPDAATTPAQNIVEIAPAAEATPAEPAAVIAAPVAPVAEAAPVTADPAADKQPAEAATQPEEAAPAPAAEATPAEPAAVVTAPVAPVAEAAPVTDEPAAGKQPAEAATQPVEAAPAPAAEATPAEPAAAVAEPVAPVAEAAPAPAAEATPAEPAAAVAEPATPVDEAAPVTADPAADKQPAEVATQPVEAAAEPEIKAMNVVGESDLSLEEKFGKKSGIAQKSDKGFEPAPLREEDEPAVEKSKSDKSSRAGKGMKVGLNDEPDPIILEAEQDIAADKASGLVDEVTDAGGKLPEDDVTALRETIRRQTSEIEGLHEIDEGNRLMGEKKYEDAIIRFDNALQKLPLRPKTVDIRKDIKFKQARCKLLQAKQYYETERFAEAKDAALGALQYDPMLTEADDLRVRAEKKEKDKQIREGIIAKDPRMSAQYLEKAKLIDDEIKRGRQFMAIGENDKAKMEFRKVMSIDDTNPDAAYYLKEIARREYKLNSKMADATGDQMIADVREKWLTKVNPDTIPVERGAGPGADINNDARRKMADKLKRLKIKELSFRSANIEDVISFLSLQSVEVDKESPEGQRGINIIMNLRRPGDPVTAAPAASPFPSSGTDDIFSDGTRPVAPVNQAAANIAPVTMQLRDITLLDAIKHLTAVTGLKYRIEDNVVVITPADVVQGDVVSKLYPVQANFQDLIGREDAASTTSDNLGGFDTTATSALPTSLGQKARMFFERGGVPFPVGTSIDYIPQIGKLIVANTVENLDKLEQMLSELNVTPKQVEIEAKFLEVAQGDLEELGMEWLLTDNWEIAENASASAAPLSARERIQIDKNNATKGLRYLSSGSGVPTAASGGTMGGILSISSILTNPQVTFILHALEQKSTANMLSAPKVTTKSGQNAEIKVVREITYPTEFDQNVQAVDVGASGATTSGSASRTKVIVTPAGFEKREVGVILSASPVVDPDGYTIDLTMIPQVVELSDWIDYGYDNFDEQGVFIQHISLPQPVFHTRTIATSISIWDGQTVVMGGLITEVALNTEDKIPFLGDIPLIGYLFRTKTSSSQKRNLLIFVTARLVDPAGNPIRKQSTEDVASRQSVDVLTSSNP